MDKKCPEILFKKIIPCILTRIKDVLKYSELCIDVNFSEPPVDLIFHFELLPILKSLATNMVLNASTS